MDAEINLNIPRIKAEKLAKLNNYWL